MTANDALDLPHELRALVARIEGLPDVLSATKARSLRKELDEIVRALRDRIAQLDPIKMPGAMFDPADPSLFGIFAAVALLGQDRVKLDSVAERRFYGSGIYAIYYDGDFPDYQPIVKTENPIYVGVATPESEAAKTPREQGTKLIDRLREHRKNIKRAANLSIDDFTCRRLVVATNWEGKAESALIQLFQPIWNKETRLIQGFGKHGDALKTRGNKRSPWDTLHEGRTWAMGSETIDVEDQKSPEQLEVEIREHFAKHPPVQELQQVLHDLLTYINAS